MFKFLLSPQHPTRPVENVTLMTKGLQGRKTTVEWDSNEKIGNKNKLILTEIFPSVHERCYLKVLISYECYVVFIIYW